MGLSTHEIAGAMERDADELSAGAVAADPTGGRAVFDHLVTVRAAAEAHLDAAEEARGRG